MVEAVLTADSALLLPARDVHALLGLDPPAAAWLPLAELTRRYPTVAFAWYPRALVIVVEDPLGVLPATRALRDRLARQARGAAPLVVTRGGPFLSLAADDSGRSLVDAGYSFRGRAALQVRRSATRGTSWALSVAPGPHLFLSYGDGDRRQPAASGRLAVGPAWVSASWTPTSSSVDGLVALARGVSLFASTRDVYVLTVQQPAWALQVARSGPVAAARLSWGPVPASPFSFPLTQ